MTAVATGRGVIAALETRRLEPVCGPDGVTAAICPACEHPTKTLVVTTAPPRAYCTQGCSWNDRLRPLLMAAASELSKSRPAADCALQALVAEIDHAAVAMPPGDEDWPEPETNGASNGKNRPLRLVPGQEEASESKPEILVGTDLTAAVDTAIEALKTMQVFQRGAMLVDIIRSADTDDNTGIVRPKGSPRIRGLPRARLRELMAQAVDWIKITKGKAAPTLPPKDFVETLAERGEWSHIKPLVGVIDFPVLTPDGRVLTTPGYDPGTRLLYEPSTIVVVPELPTPEDARRAVAVLHDLLVDFPFDTGAGQSAWLAGVLTLIARPAIAGPVPMFIYDANVMSSGKTMLAEMTSLLVLGRDPPRRPAPKQEEEWAKSLLGIAISGDRMILFDNVRGTVKSESLEMVLTGEWYQQRKLGENKELTLPWKTVVFLTSNNTAVGSETSRRALHIRLRSRVERPEQRDTSRFRYPKITMHVAQNRPALLASALTILRAYVVAGRPKVDMRPMGSYEAWSNVVQAAIVWAGGEDPVKSQDGLRESSDLERANKAALLHAWHDAFGEEPVTAAQIVKRAMELGGTELRQAIAGIAPPNKKADAGPDAGALGRKLSLMRQQIVDGLEVDQAAAHTRAGVLWRVRVVCDVVTS